MAQQLHDLDLRSRQWFELVWNQKRLEAIDKMLDPKAVLYGLSDVPGQAEGIAEFKKFHAQFCDAFPDIRIEVQDTIVQGDKCAIRFTFAGTHRGDGLGIAATQRPMNSSAMTFIRWRDGKIVEAWNEIDRAGMIAQLK